jgi:phosphohistidine phosphatase
MKTLLVLRHAKSSWDHSHLSDFDRPLNGRGERSAPAMGEFMRAKGLVPEVIIASPARRARMTAEKAASAGEFEAEIQFDERIYGAGANSLTYIVAEIEDSFETAMIVGHNPGFEMLVRALTGEGDRMPTAALAVIDLDIEGWSGVRTGAGSLRGLFLPREILGF